MEMEEGWGAVAAVPDPGPKPPVPAEDPELPSLWGVGPTLREAVPSGGLFLEPGSEGWAEPLTFGLIVSSVWLSGASSRQFLVLALAGGYPWGAAGLPGSRDSPALLMARWPCLRPGPGRPGGGRSLLVGECVPAGAGGVSHRPGGFSAMRGRHGPGAILFFGLVGGRNMDPGSDDCGVKEDYLLLRRGLSARPWPSLGRFRSPWC